MATRTTHQPENKLSNTASRKRMERAASDARAGREDTERRGVPNEVPSKNGAARRKR